MPTSDPSPEKMVPELELLAQWMDSAFRIPGLGVRVGLDPLIGLIPGLGDALSSFISLYLVASANRLGLPRITLLRMTLNLLLDVTIGSLPLVGDVFDVYWKANMRNMQLLRRHLAAAPAERRRSQWSDWLFVAGIALLVLGTLAGSLALIAWALLALF
jgi:hypothetical protein